MALYSYGQFQLAAMAIGCDDFSVAAIHPHSHNHAFARMHVHTQACIRTHGHVASMRMAHLIGGRFACTTCTHSSVRDISQACNILAPSFAHTHVPRRHRIE